MVEAEYLESLKDLQLLCQEALKVSIATSGRQVPPWREEYASYIFAKQVGHGQSLLKILPSMESGKTEFWDISSVFTLARSMMETYYAFYHMCIENILKEEADFRFALWDFHSESELLEMDKFMNPESTKIPNQEKKVSEKKKILEDCSYFQNLPNSKQKRLLDGQEGFYLSMVERGKRSSIPENYHRGVYKYLSNYAHTASFAVKQLKLFRAEDPQSLNLMHLGMVWATMFLSFAVRDFLEIFPDQKQKVDTEVYEILQYSEAHLPTS